MSVSEKIKTIIYKIQKNKAQCNLEVLVNMNFVTGKDILAEKDLIEKAAALKRFEYYPLGKELKLQTSVAEKQYQSFGKVFNHDEKKSE